MLLLLLLLLSGSRSEDDGVVGGGCVNLCDGRSIEMADSDSSLDRCALFF